MAKDFLPDSLTLSWQKPNNQSLEANRIRRFPSLAKSNGLNTACSQATVPADQWKAFEPFYCKAELASQNTVTRVVRQTPVVCLPPEIVIRVPPLEDFHGAYLNATLLCKADNLHTKQTTIKWLEDGNVLDSGFTTSAPIQQSNGYSIVSELIVTKKDWYTEKTYSCQVKNEKFNEIRNVSKSSVCEGCDGTNVPVRVETIPPSFEDIFLTKSAILTCRISNIPYSQDIAELKVSWLREYNNTRLETKIGQATGQENKDLWFVDATTTICAEEWQKGETYLCQVQLPLLASTETKSLKKATGSTYLPPAVYVLPPPSEQLALQETATITCLLKGFYPNNFFVKWLRNNEQVAASEYFISQPVQESKSPERYFTYSTLNVKEQDWSYGATYTCVVGHEALPLQTTQKTVDKNTAQATPPSVFPLVSCCSPTSEEPQGSVTFACLAAGYSPGNAEITWEPSEASRIKTFPEVVPNTSDGTYMRSSQYTAPSAGLETTSYTCIVKHATAKNQEREQRQIIKRDCAERNPAPIRVRLLNPDCDTEDAETNLELACILWSSGPGEASVEWLTNGAADVERTKKKVTLTKQESSGYSSYIPHNITKKSWDKGDQYTCRVTPRSKTQNTEMYNTSKCKACYQSGQTPTVSIFKPSYRDLVEGTATVTCLVEGFFLEKIQITWNVDGSPSTERQAAIVKTDGSGRQNATSSHTVSLEQWRKGTTFQCQVATMCLEEITKDVTIKENKGTQTIRPRITITQTYRDVSSNGTIAQILVCDVSGFSPMEISISWKKNSVALNKALYDNGPLLPSGNAYTTYSILKISRNELGDGRDSYVCVVYHSSSPTPIMADERAFPEEPKPRAPTVELLQSVDQVKKTVLLKCVASDYWPKKVTIKWKGSLQSMDVIFIEQKMSNGRYTASSQLNITFSQWQEADSNDCEVVHRESSTKSLKSVSRKDWIMPTPLTLSLSTDPHCPSLGLSDSSHITLLCSVSGYLEDIEVTWEAGGKVQKSLKMEHPQGKGDQFHTTSNLTIPLKEWNKLQEYICKVTQLGKNITQTRHISKCTACKGSIPPPSLYLLKPSLEGLLIQREALLICLVVGYELDHGVLTWMVGGANVTKQSTMGDTRDHKNKTKSLESRLVISRDVWNSGSKVHCVLSHSCSLFPKEEQIIQNIKDPNKTKAPSLSWVTPSSTQLMQQTTEALAWLECTASGFFPAETLFRWKKDDASVDASEYITGAPVAEDGSPTFTAQSVLRIPSSEWESRIMYTCMVGHESSPDMYNISQILYDSLEPTSPEVMAFHTSEKEAGHKLICFATGFHPKNIDIRWSAPGTDLSCSSNSSALVALSDGKYQRSCNLALSEEEWRKPQTYTCAVNHSSTNTLIKKVLHSSGMVPAPINATVTSMQPPSFEDLLTNKSAALTCMAPLADAMMNWTASWLMDGRPANPQAVTTEVLNRTTNTTWICSQLVVNLTEWRATLRFTCTISFGLEEVEQLYERRNGTMKPPKVYLQQQSSKEDPNVTLLCIATDFYPGEVFVKWQEENTEMSLKGHDAHDLKCNHERERCSLLSILEVPRSQWMTGVSYTCLIAHVSSANIIFRRAIVHSDSRDCPVTTSAGICAVCNETEYEYSELNEVDGAWNRVATYLILFLLSLFYGGLVTFFKVK